MKLHRKVFLSVMTLLLLVTTLTTSTYAWFKINSAARVEGFEFEVVGGEGFLMSIDNESFSNDLTNEQMNKAILLGLAGDTYELSNGKIVYKQSGIEVTDEEIKQVINKNIMLLPVTSQNGYEFTDMHGLSQKATSGRFIEFDVYFKTASDDLEDERKYDISLMVGRTTFNDAHNKTINPTSIQSSIDNITLVADMNTINGNMKAQDEIAVYSANAMRFSIEEAVSSETETIVRADHTKIYEFVTDDDLGSYAHKGNELDLYNPDKNAMFTYYNNQKITKIEAMETLPSTIRYNQTQNKITTYTTEGVKELMEMPVITRVESGESSKKVTVRIWLEGWDADCFDGIAKSIKVSLTFASKKV